MKKFVTLLLLTFWSAVPVANADVTFYGQCGFKGPGVTLDLGEYTANELAQVGIPDNAIKSIRVSNGFEVSLYEDDGFAGRYGTLKASDTCLEDDNFDNLVSSLTITASNVSFGSVESSSFGNPATTPPKAGTVSVYANCNFTGRSAKLAVGEYNNAQLNKLGMSNNSISAVKVPDGYKVELFINDFLRGRSGTLSKDEDCITGTYNDAITSLVVTKVETLAVTTTEPVATVYAHCNFRGGNISLPPGQYDAQALKDARVEEDTVSSIKLTEGYRATVYTDSPFGGKSLILTSDDDCLDNDGFNEQLSSLVIEAINETANEAANGSSSLVVNPSARNTGVSARLQKSLECVEQYVQQNACDATRLSAIQSRCEFARVSELSDGYLQGHIEAGNCNVELWDELAKRTANPSLR